MLSVPSYVLQFLFVVFTNTFYTLKNCSTFLRVTINILNLAKVSLILFKKILILAILLIPNCKLQTYIERIFLDGLSMDSSVAEHYAHILEVADLSLGLAHFFPSIIGQGVYPNSPSLPVVGEIIFALQMGYLGNQQELLKEFPKNELKKTAVIKITG